MEITSSPNLFPIFFRYWGAEGGNEKNNNDKSNFGNFWGGTFETAMGGTFVAAAGGTFETVPTS